MSFSVSLKDSLTGREDFDWHIFAFLTLSGSFTHRLPSHRSAELVCQSAQPAGPRIEVSFISRPPYHTNIWGSYLPGANVPPRPSGDPVQKRIRSVYNQCNAALGVTAWSNQLLFFNDRHRVAVHNCAWWFFLHYCVKMFFSNLHFFIFSPLFFSSCHLFAGVITSSLALFPLPLNIPNLSRASCFHLLQIIPLFSNLKGFNFICGSFSF